MTPSQEKMKTLSREAVKLVKDKAPAIVDEQIGRGVLDADPDDSLGVLPQLAHQR